MGFIDTVTDALSGSGGSGSKSDDIAEEFESEEEDIVEADGEFEDGFEDGEDEVWDTPYQFFEDMVENDGHIDGMDFTKSAAFYEIKNSNLYRDRIQSGKSTIETVAAAKETIQSVRSSDSGEGYGEKAEKLREANELIDQVDKVSGKEDELVNEALSIGRDLATNMAETVQNSKGDVDSNVTAHREEL